MQRKYPTDDSPQCAYAAQEAQSSLYGVFHNWQIAQRTHAAAGHLANHIAQSPRSDRGKPDAAQTGELLLYMGTCTNCTYMSPYIW